MGKSLKISPVNFTWLVKDYSFIPALIRSRSAASSSEAGGNGGGVEPPLYRCTTKDYSFTPPIVIPTPIRSRSAASSSEAGGNGGGVEPPLYRW